MQQDGPAISSTDQPLLQQQWRSAVERLVPAEWSRRGAGLALAVGIELLIVLLLLSLSFGRSEPERKFVPIASFDVSAPPAPDETPEQQPEPASASAPEQAEPQPDDAEPMSPPVTPLPSAIPVPRLNVPPQPAPTPTPSPTPTSRIGAVVRSDNNYGPADTGNSRGEDSPVVGTAPDGSPLYAARWYREPTDGELAGYLSTASSTGWGLIACRTAPNWRVEDCTIVDEYPNGSGIARATQAAAWQFKVRPPRLAGQYQVGSWVRIRIDYTRGGSGRRY